jgi:hypothetical protein
MMHKRLYLYATKVFTYWQFEYNIQIASDPEMLLDTPIITQIIQDCYQLNIQPCNCCGIIYGSLYSSSGLTIKQPDKPS